MTGTFGDIRLGPERRWSARTLFSKYMRLTSVVELVVSARRCYMNTTDDMNSEKEGETRCLHIGSLRAPLEEQFLELLETMGTIINLREDWDI